MLFNAQNAAVALSRGDMDYIRFGRGARILVLLPGLGDSLQTVKGTALPMAFLYRAFAREYTVYAFSRRKNHLPGDTTLDMARDLAEAMLLLGISRADVLGVSMGGMIAQHLAIEFPERVNRLILAVTAPCPNPILCGAVEEWVSLAQEGDHAAFLDSNLRLIYSNEYCRKNRWMVPLLGKLTKPASYDRFFIHAQACLTHNALDSLGRIQTPTLVIGGGQDKALGCEASGVLAAAIPGAKLHIYPQWGHGLYEEAGDFNSLVLDFLK